MRYSVGVIRADLGRCLVRGLWWLNFNSPSFVPVGQGLNSTRGAGLNHNQWFIKKLNITPIHWQTEREVDFRPDDKFPHEPAQQAGVIVKFLDLDGPHRVLGKPDANQMIYYRAGPNPLVSAAGKHKFSCSTHTAKTVQFVGCDKVGQVFR